MSRNGRLSLQFATVRDISVRRVDDWDTIQGLAMSPTVERNWKPERAVLLCRWRGSVPPVRDVEWKAELGDAGVMRNVPSDER